jgi:hypothetical protein
MQKLRFLPLAAMTLALSLFTGCDDEEGSVTINGFGVDNANPAAGSSFNTKGTADFETDKATVSYTVSGPDAGKIIPPSSFAIASGSSLGKLFTVPAGTAAGSYSVTVTVTDEDGIAASQSASFCVGGACGGGSGMPLDKLEPDLDVGAQSVTGKGSFIDVDGGEVFTEGTKDVSKVDAVFFADAAGQISLMSPSYAATNSLGGVSTWGTKLQTVIVEAGTSEIATKEAAMAKVGSATTQIAAVTSGHYYAMKLANNEYAVVKIASLSGTGKAAVGTITLFVE